MVAYTLTPDDVKLLVRCASHWRLPSDPQYSDTMARSRAAQLRIEADHAEREEADARAFRQLVNRAREAGQ